MLERDGAILDERHGLTVALHRHHDVEARLANLPHLALPGRVGDLDDAPGQAEVAHELAQGGELRKLRRPLLTGELDEQDRVGRADDRFVHRRAERCDVARQLDHRTVDELDRGRLERDDVPSQVHRLVKRREVHDAERFVHWQRRQLELDLAEVAESSFGADEQLRRVECAARRQVEVVARDAPLELRHARFDLFAFARIQVAQRGDELSMSRRSLRRSCVDGAERHRLPAREPGLHLEDVVHHVAVAQRPSAATVVRRHAADRGLCRRRDIHRIPEGTCLRKRAFKSSSTMPGSTHAVASAASTSSSRFRCLLSSR